MNSKRIRQGLYQAEQYLIEERQTAIGWTWRVMDTENYSDPWRGDFATKREALESLT